MLLLVYALIKAPDQGWDAASTWLELAGAVLLLGCFVVIERTARDPILPLSIFRVPGLATANLTGLIGFAGMLSMFYFLTLYMQNVLGYSPVAAGAAYLPLTFAIGISAGGGIQAAHQDRQPSGDLRGLKQLRVVRSLTAGTLRFISDDALACA